MLEGPCDFLSVFALLIDVLGRMFGYFELCDNRYIESHALLQDVSQNGPYPVHCSGVQGSPRNNLSLVQILPKVIAALLLLSTASPSHVFCETVLYFDTREHLAYCVVECTIRFLVLDVYEVAGSVYAFPSESVESC